MKYTSEIVINLPLEKVVALFDHPDNMFKWMEGLKKVTPLTKEQGQTGSRMEMYFDLGKRKFHIVETILEKNLPQLMRCKYNTVGMENIVDVHFESINEDQTRYWTDNEFKFKGIFILMKFFSSNMFKKQSYKYLVDFKNFAEKQELNHG